MDSGQVWMPNIVDDYLSQIEKKYSKDDEEKISLLTEAAKRTLTSNNTNKEIKKNDFQ
jgi:hypothetical protein